MAVALGSSRRPGPRRPTVRALGLSMVLWMAAMAAFPADGAEGRLNYIVPGATGSAEAGPRTGAARNPRTGAARNIVRVAAEAEARPPVPDVLFADGSGMPIHLRRYLGQVVVVNFWTSACGPCIKQMVFLDRLQGDFGGQPLAVLAVSEDRDGIPGAKAFLARQKYTFLRPFADPGSAMAQALGVRGLPTSLVIDRNGRLVTRVEGPYEWDSPEIIARMRQLLSER